MPSAEELRSQLASIDNKAELLRHKILGKEKAETEKRKARITAMSEMDKKECTDLFNLLDKGRKGNVAPADFIEASKNVGVPLVNTEADDMLLGFDLDKDGALNSEEFTHWWLGSKSILRFALRREELNRRMENIAAEHSRAPEWTPNTHFHFDFTIGDVPKGNFTPKGNVLVNALHSTPELKISAAEAAMKEFCSGDDDEDTAMPNPKTCTGVLRADIKLKPTATDADVKECLEALEAVLEEYSEQEDSYIIAKIKSTSKGGEKFLSLAIFGKEPKKQMRLRGIMREMLDPEDPIGSLRQLLEEEVGLADMPHGRFMVGFEFGNDPAQIINRFSGTPLLDLLNHARAVFHADFSQSAMTDAIDAALVREFKDNGISSRRRRIKFVNKLILSHMLHSLDVSAEFANPRDMIKQTLDEIEKFPEEAALDVGFGSAENLDDLMREAQMARVGIAGLTQHYFLHRLSLWLPSNHPC